ncbi:hypothetical protein A3K63_04575 [Candidatus Micrarchaeota archaeon RBG_16_49_10]|nr:MAG: hypothetical protein A3K63_04575 [Candidatus Micrarchaeota archaeon RBG_16_49_10]
MLPLALYELTLAANEVAGRYAGFIPKVQDQNPFANYQFTGVDKCIIGGLGVGLLAGCGIYIAARVSLSLSSKEPSQPAPTRSGYKIIMEYPDGTYLLEVPTRDRKIVKVDDADSSVLLIEGGRGV